MSNDIERKELWKSLGNIKKPKEWMGAAEKLGFFVVDGKGSHWTIRREGYDLSDPRSLVTTIHKGLFKQANEYIFKDLMKNGGCSEDEIWIALGKLKQEE